VSSREEHKTMFIPTPIPDIAERAVVAMSGSIATVRTTAPLQSQYRTRNAFFGFELSALSWPHKMDLLHRDFTNYHVQ